MLFHMVKLLPRRKLACFTRICSSTAHSGVKPVKICNTVEAGPVLEQLCSKYANHSAAIQKVLTKNEVLQDTKFSSWYVFIEELCYYGFSVPDCLLIISNEPEVLNLNNHALSEVLSTWNNCPLGNEYMKLLIINRPQLLFLPVVNLQTRIPRLHSFVTKPKSLLLLLLRCPNVLTEQWQYVEQKIDYLVDVMRVDKSEILRSSALNKSLHHIQLRHTILEKCGLYVPPSKYEHKRLKNEKSAFKNAPLKRIVDNEDISFARKICKISAEEYDVYKDMFQERADRSDGEYNSESDSDSDEE